MMENRDIVINANRGKPQHLTKKAQLHLVARLDCCPPSKSMTLALKDDQRMGHTPAVKFFRH